MADIRAMFDKKVREIDRWHVYATKVKSESGEHDPNSYFKAVEMARMYLHLLTLDHLQIEPPRSTGIFKKPLAFT